MNDISIPCMLMRGGTSKGPLFLASDLPADAESRNDVLLSLMGSPDIRQIDGIGGADSLTSQALIIGPSTREDADVDYLFAQVAVAQRQVDTSANCGNMLAAVACFAIERSLVVPDEGITRVRLFNLNTHRLVHAHVPTPNCQLTYEGATRIPGVPGTGAGIVLDFIDPAGSRTGRLLPTGNATDSIDGVPMSLVDFAIPVVLIPAAAVGKTGYESKAQLDADGALLARIEHLRSKAATLMGLPNPARSVLPKVALLARAREGGSIASRFYVPWNCHVAHSTTGALCIAAATNIGGTIAAELASPASGDPHEIVIEHPSGSLTIRIETKSDLPDAACITRASVVLTARPLFDGYAFARPASELLPA
ncbi:MAG TPA: 4-oxalomesaconate tautomerase [Vicinamibacterales bacterium]|nr:4-oxalomesaconate tautomerase [Vicinamibacterales bacterium]